ncbi:flagellar hook-associated protein FlgL [Lysobacter yangpyeongensis]|uniref:Flagellar hook-associated protein FlgL n=1 Tax=Lysobacter yangpyeongensis TaxID=346182 RepID=A0ABW0SJ73_9GAMM
MTLRISTAGLHAQGLAALLRHQSEIARTQQQITTGKRFSQAKEDPVAASSAQRLDHVLAMLGEYRRGAEQVDNRLRLQEEALADAGDMLSRARELAIQGNNAPLSDNDRKAIAAEIRQLRAGLISVANRDDGNGRRLFAGTRDGVVPFVDNAGSVSYLGDDGQNNVDIAPEIAVADTDPGSAVFLRVRTGDGYSRASAGGANAGSGVLEEASVGDPAAWNGRALSVRFTSATDYEVVDASGPALSPPVTGTWSSGQAIPDPAAGLGVQFRISGVPAAGDTFSIERAPTRDVFATLDMLADALEAPSGTSADAARRANAMASAIGDIATAQDHMLTVRSGTGMRLQELDRTAERRSSEEVTLAGTLSELRDIDLAEAVSRLSLEMTALEAAQKSLLRVQGLSLFDQL